MKQCSKSSETYSKIEQLTNDSQESKDIYNQSLGKVKTKIDNYVKMLNKFNI